MPNQTDKSCGKSLQYTFGSVRLYFDPDQLFHPSLTKRPFDEADRMDTVTQSAIPPGSVTAACERAVQALRDVRHLLPADGVVIVDAVLDHVPGLAARLDLTTICELTADGAPLAIRESRKLRRWVVVRPPDKISPTHAASRRSRVVTR